MTQGLSLRLMLSLRDNFIDILLHIINGILKTGLVLKVSKYLLLDFICFRLKVRVRRMHKRYTVLEPGILESVLLKPVWCLQVPPLILDETLKFSMIFYFLWIKFRLDLVN